MYVYFPVIRWKQGERDALRNLPTEIKMRIVPIIEFPYGCDCTDKKFTEFTKTVGTDWGPYPFYIDLSTVDYADTSRHETHPAFGLLKDLYDSDLFAMPIIRLDVEQDLFDAFRLARTHMYFQHVGLRITRDADDSALQDAMDTLEKLGIEPTLADLIIDLGDVSTGHLPSTQRILRDIANQFGNSYRRRILVSGAIPQELDIERDSEDFLPRHDWQLWLEIHQKHELSDIMFGDYVTVPVNFVEIQYLGAPKAKYTLENKWFVQKGHRPRGRDDQRQVQARKIIEKNFFRGEQYSFGDQRISDCASGRWGPGNATNWVTNDVNQHITYVVSQVSSILGGL